MLSINGVEFPFRGPSEREAKAARYPAHLSTHTSYCFLQLRFRSVPFRETIYISTNICCYFSNLQQSFLLVVCRLLIVHKVDSMGLKDHTANGDDVSTEKRAITFYHGPLKEKPHPPIDPTGQASNSARFDRRMD